MKRSFLMLLTVIALVALGATNGTNGATTQNTTWATYQQMAIKEIKRGGIYGHRWGQASPKLKFIVTQMIYKKFGYGYTGRTALRCAVRESGLNPAAISPTNDHHVFQLNYSAHHNAFDFRRLDIPDVGYGITAGWRLYKGAGWSPWNGPC